MPRDPFASLPGASATGRVKGAAAKMAGTGRRDPFSKLTGTSDADAARTDTNVNTEAASFQDLDALSARLEAHDAEHGAVRPSVDPKTPPEVIEQSETLKGFRQRAKTENARMAAATDASFYRCLVFPTTEHATAFFAALGLDAAKTDLFLDGMALAKQMQIELPPAPSLRLKTGVARPWRDMQIDDGGLDALAGLLRSPRR